MANVRSVKGMRVGSMPVSRITLAHGIKQLDHSVNKELALLVPSSSPKNCSHNALALVATRIRSNVTRKQRPKSPSLSFYSQQVDKSCNPS